VGPVRFLLSLVALVAATGLLVAPAGATSCAFVVVWNDIAYDPWDTQQEIEQGAALGEGTLPSCDGEGCRGEDKGALPVYRLVGVDQHVAIGGVPTTYGDVLLAGGFFPQLPSHPVHEAIYGSPRKPSERRGWHCEVPIVARGEVADVGYGLGVHFERPGLVPREGKRAAIYIDAHTRVTGFDEQYGTPYVQAGNRIEARVRTCRRPGGRFKVVADRVANAQVVAVP
jgi:Family of unknown function (DUF6281)